MLLMKNESLHNVIYDYVNYAQNKIIIWMYD